MLTIAEILANVAGVRAPELDRLTKERERDREREGWKYFEASRRPAQPSPGKPVTSRGCCGRRQPEKSADFAESALGLGR